MPTEDNKNRIGDDGSQIKSIQFDGSKVMTEEEYEKKSHPYFRIKPAVFCNRSPGNLM
jgi:hypothetical protein